MLKNYLLVTFRNLFKHKFYSIINISGLSIGIACSILILLWVFDELSFDKFHPKADRLYQVWVNSDFDGKINSWNSVPLASYMGLKNTNVHIKNTAVSDWGGNHLLTVNEKPILKQGMYVSEEFLEMFEFELLQGDPTLVLDDASSIVITASTAQALFGEEDPMGQTIRINDKDELKVSGVLADLPKNSSFQLDFMLPYGYWRNSSEWLKENEDNWGNYSFQVYMELDDPSHEAAVEESIRNILIEHGETDLKPALFLHPLLSWRLYSSFENGKNKGGMSDYVQLFSIIAIFILVIACINFMNLATARSERRAREVGIRKSVGSSRSEIMFQFVGESMLISLIAFLIALILVELSLPYYNTLVDKRLSLDYLSVNSWLFGLSIILVTGITAGSYPAFYLSSFQPIKVLKGKIKQGRKGTLPRKILVTLQFGFSIVLILGTIAIYQQIQLVKSRELGYDRNNLISIDYNNGIRKNYQVLKDGLLRTGVVAGVTKSNSSITSINSNNFVSWPGKPEDQKVIFTTLTAEYDYTKTMGIKMLEGRDFSTEFGNDTSSMIINKAALELMGLDDPLGTELEMWGNKYTLIGVMDDVMMGSPYEPVKPLAAIFDPEWVGTMTVRLGPTDDLQASLEKVKDVFLQYNPAYPFDYTFVDESFQKKFTTINMTSKIANLFAILTIIITVLGLFGLAAFTAEQRTKEIGIRKVLGASVTHIVYTMTQDFSRLVLFAFLLASPLAWWLLSKYLERYTIRTEIEWWFFVITGALAFILAATVVSTQAFKAARANPVKSLRSE